MAYVVVYTDKGEQVWSSQLIAATVRRLECPGNVIGSSVASGLRRAAQDAEALEQGRDPERSSERAMRLADEKLSRGEAS